MEPEHIAPPPRPRMHKGAFVVATLVTGLVVALIIVGSRGLRDFDSALIGYAVASLFAIAVLLYRYVLWILRPPTGRYFRAGWSSFFSWQNFRRFTTLVPRALWTDIFAQTFILKRSLYRWVMHMSLFWGVLLSLFVTIPLTFGWLHFTLEDVDTYRIWFFGLPLFTFPVEAGIGFAFFHALDITAFLLMVGVVMALWRRLRDSGLLATQRFGFDMVPLVLLAAIAITGLALTASSMWWGGRFYWFISLTHQVTVVAWFLTLPFGKFFHIIQRPASIGVTLYQKVNQNREHSEQQTVGVCKRCGEELPSQQFIRDLRAVLQDLDQNYDLGAHDNLHEYCPHCKRVLRGQAYYAMMKKRFV
uniref:Uncharacterized protein n=1 Tax=Thermosporothrix sp. COM3 TaxID=2490863 RepID=A0A455SGL6_9CHLR|nr:hypothetical protein KTC_12590 [Thermosporothrix sp. COM3]